MTHDGLGTAALVLVLFGAAVNAIAAGMLRYKSDQGKLIFLVSLALIGVGFSIGSSAWAKSDAGSAHAEHPYGDDLPIRSR